FSARIGITTEASGSVPSITGVEEVQATGRVASAPASSVEASGPASPTVESGPESGNEASGPESDTGTGTALSSPLPHAQESVTKRRTSDRVMRLVIARSTGSRRRDRRRVLR